MIAHAKHHYAPIHPPILERFYNLHSKHRKPLERVSLSRVECTDKIKAEKVHWQSAMFHRATCSYHSLFAIWLIWRMCTSRYATPKNYIRNTHRNGSFNDTRQSSMANNPFPFCVSSAGFCTLHRIREIGFLERKLWICSFNDNIGFWTKNEKYWNYGNLKLDRCICGDTKRIRLSADMRELEFDIWVMVRERVIQITISLIASHLVLLSTLRQSTCQRCLTWRQSRWNDKHKKLNDANWCTQRTWTTTLSTIIMFRESLVFTRRTKYL